MSIDGRHFVVGTVEGIFVHEYVNRQLRFTKQYAIGKPLITDVASSRDGRYIFAAATLVQNVKHSAIFFFDNFREPEARIVSPLLQLGSIIVMAIVLAATIFIVIRKKQWFTKKCARLFGECAHGNF